jgi:hypothetical protein
VAYHGRLASCHAAGDPGQSLRRGVTSDSASANGPRFTQIGATVADFTAASTPKFLKRSGARPRSEQAPRVTLCAVDGSTESERGSVGLGREQVPRKSL